LRTPPSVRSMASADVIGAPVQQAFADPKADIFNDAKVLFIKQEMAAIELCGIEAKQRYRISEAQKDGDRYKEGNVFLYMTEEYACLQRICCGPHRRLKLKVHNGPNKEAQVIQTMEKPFALNGCCFLRPSFEVMAGANKIGRVEDPCRCCTMDQQIFDSNDELRFTTAGSICQLGMFCPCCDSVRFPMARQGLKFGQVEKMPMDCSELLLGTNRFIVDMENIKDPSDRRLALASAMLLDLTYFEAKKEKS